MEHTLTCKKLEFVIFPIFIMRFLSMHIVDTFAVFYQKTHNKNEYTAEEFNQIIRK